MEQVGLYMSETLHWIAPGATIEEVARQMVQSGCRSLLIREKNDYLGIVTEGDITRKVVAAGGDIRRMTAGEIMSQPLVTVDHEESMPRVFVLMQKNNIRHLPVTFRGKIAGMLSVTDFLKYFTVRFGLNSKASPPRP